MNETFTPFSNRQLVTFCGFEISTLCRLASHAMLSSNSVETILVINHDKKFGLARGYQHVAYLRAIVVVAGLLHALECCHIYVMRSFVAPSLSIGHCSFLFGIAS